MLKQRLKTVLEVFERPVKNMWLFI